MLLERDYEIIEDPPKPIKWEEYCEEILNEYYELLNDNENDESIFQRFFEENPSFLPGAFEIFGKSGHYPYMGALISQPNIGNVFQRKPDFMWLAQDSLTFTPVFIEIESPNKKMFNKNRTATADFNQAINQIYEWKYILNQPTNIEMFKDFFDLPLYIRKKTFKPQFLLIYGRRKEYEGNDILTGNRAARKTDDIDIMSFDRLVPDYKCKRMVTCKVHNGRYKVINISPTYEYMPGLTKELTGLDEFKEKIRNMKYTSEERKHFLEERYQYWINFGTETSKGIIINKDKE